jgi:multimeric flavodoxin WrbA
MTLKALAFNCTLKSSGKPSSTELMLKQMLAASEPHRVEGEIIRIVDHDVKPGVTSDEGKGDDWPALRRKVLEAQIFILGTPIWLGQPSSVCKRLLERMDAFLSETDDTGRMVSYGRVACVTVVGNEDGAHHVSAETYQALSDVGFTIPANAVSYWVGEAMHGTDYKDLKGVPDVVKTAIAMLVSNTVHLARLLQQQPFPDINRRAHRARAPLRAASAPDGDPARFWGGAVASHYH